MKLTRADLYSLEQYAEVRNDFRVKVMAHKKHRTVQVGPHATLLFEDRLTMHYQVQEMLRVERIFEAAGIEEELEVYNPLIPDGGNWKATFMIEYDDPAQRKIELARLIGIDRQVWMRVGDYAKVYAISNEDLERETEAKTSSVHFLRFELSEHMVDAAKQGSAIGVGIDHEHYRHAIDPLADEVRRALLQDLN